MRLIDVDALKKRMSLELNNQSMYLPADFKEMLDEQPTIEAEPVKHGQWRNHGDYVTTAYGSLNVYECSACSYAITIDEFDNYCPHCGARMDGGEA